ncbi:MAG: 23S rRNA (adenine(2503)-C(2))-methyltransferase RlmN [Patescibacteria group bacterium]|jgi:23S rRNA (adenine2503-C2)-methyltransferase
MNLGNLETILADQPKYRRQQVYQAIFKNLATDWRAVMVLPLVLRQKLATEWSLDIKAEVKVASDGKTQKALIFLADGQAIETVLLRHDGGRNTVCISSQVGCAMACDFCATGRMGWQRNLTAMEIVEQVLFFARGLAKAGERVTNVVVMGMGEPLMNYDAVLSALHLLNQPNGFNLGARRMSISTVGIVEGIKKLTKEPAQFNLAWSLHAPNDKLRGQIMPINKKYPLLKVLAALSEYVKTTKRRLMIEYVMLRGINDAPTQAKELAALLQKNLAGPFMVNLIAYNPTSGYHPATAQSVAEFSKILKEAGITVTERYRFGREIKGACGQLAGQLV